MTHHCDKYVKIFASSQIFICHFENLGKGTIGPHSQQNRFLLLLPIKWVVLMDLGRTWPRAGFWTQIFFWQIFSFLWIKMCERRTFFHFWTRFFDISSLYLNITVYHSDPGPSKYGFGTKYIFFDVRTSYSCTLTGPQVCPCYPVSQ